MLSELYNLFDLIHLMLMCYVFLMFSHLLVVLATGRWNVIDVLGGRQVSGDIILILFCVPLVINIHLANACGHHHLKQRQKVKNTIRFTLEEENDHRKPLCLVYTRLYNNWQRKAIESRLHFC